MLRLHASLLLASFLLVVAACGGENGIEPEPEGPPDLTGAYTLQSFSSGILTGGEVLTPPIISGTFTLQQSAAVGGEAGGTMTLDITVPDETGGSANFTDEGSYTVRADGTWEQAGQLVQGSGTYTLQGNTLTVDVTDPPIAVSNSVWQRR